MKFFKNNNKSKNNNKLHKINRKKSKMIII